MKFDIYKLVKAGYPARTVDGRPVTDWKWFEEAGTLVVQIEGQLYMYPPNGQFTPDVKGHEMDLELIPFKRQGWINIYPCATTGASIYWTQEDADEEAGERRVACAMVEWEE